MIDPRFRFSVNLYGAPAMSLTEFPSYQQDVIIGASLAITAPLGQYDASRLVNLGNNRWSFKPELGCLRRCRIDPRAEILLSPSDFLRTNASAAFR
ncbi:transporter [Pseudomonas rhizophila]